MQGGLAHFVLAHGLVAIAGRHIAEHQLLVGLFVGRLLHQQALRQGNGLLIVTAGAPLLHKVQHDVAVECP